ncbi:MAG: Putative E3 ubiquitin-protein ligase [Sporothrix epigloea]
MARPPDPLPGTAPPTTKAMARGGSQDPVASDFSRQTPAVGPSPQTGLAQHRIRNTRNVRTDPYTHSTSATPVGLESSDLVNIDLSQLQVESDSSDSDFRVTSRAADSSRHTRSISNSFPSLFLPKKKKVTQDDLSQESGDLVLNDKGSPKPSPSNDGHQSKAGLPPSVGPASRKASFSTGPCITCGSLMRWARGATAFRCGICLTVNDLVPTDKLSAGAGEVALELQATSSSPISIEQTQSIIAECLQSYLKAVLQDVHVISSVRPQAEAQARPFNSLGREDQSSSTTVPRHTQSLAPANDFVSRHESRLPNTRRRLSTGKTSARERASPAHSPSDSSSYGHQLNPIDPTLVSSNDVLQGHSQPSSSTKKQKGTRKDGEEREAKRIFLRLEDYLVSHLVSVDSLDSSFVVTPQLGRASSSQTRRPDTTVGPKTNFEDKAPTLLKIEHDSRPSQSHNKGRSHLDKASRRRRGEGTKCKSDAALSRAAISRSIDIDWAAVNEWYRLILNAGVTWESMYIKLVDEGTCASQPFVLLQEIESHILKGQQHAQRVLMKCIETVLKRPGRRIGESKDFRFLLIALANPLLQASCKLFTGTFQCAEQSRAHAVTRPLGTNRGTGPASGQHSVIIKRILGLLSNASDDWRSRIITCLSRYPQEQFLQTKDLVGGFLAYRLIRHNEKKEESKVAEISDPLVPKVPEGASAASFHAALNQASGSATNANRPTEKKILHGDDWQIKAAVRVLSLFFTANHSTRDTQTSSNPGDADARRFGRSRQRGQIVPTSDFYITLLDNCDLVSDFERWEQQTTKFSFCQYPFLLSVWAKIQILEYDARRQMKNKARDAFFDSIMTRRNFDQHLILNVRRNCLVEDSLKGVSAAIGSGTDDIKKGLRIIFNGEEGIDAGGLRKEWFLLLVREVFNPDHGMFTYDEESHYCYFNSASFETSDQFFLVGVVLGLAIYNSTILDVALPPFAFRKLLHASPAATSGVLPTSARPFTNYALADLAEYQPRLARGLQQLLDYDGDVESTFCLDFSITVERFGHATTVPLCPGGESRPVTNSNRKEYVDLYVRYLLDTSVARQFDPFKRGFYTVCGCNALSLFRPEEIELLVRGSDEPLDVASLRLAASYENWPSNDPLEKEPTIKWFWEIFEEASPEDQRKLLIFITGSDRIPATGPASLSIRILYLGNDTGRYPTARTCFNILTLYRYASKDVMAVKLWGAVNGSEGFGLK